LDTYLMIVKNKKVAKIVKNPVQSKTAKIGIAPNNRLYPEFKAEQIDRNGPWGWDHFEPFEIQNVFQRIFESQKLTWQDLVNNGSHLININSLCSEAQKRLNQIQKEDLDQLFSLRLTGPKRIWGIKEGAILWLLWWDPNHTVYPSAKKNT
jgi:hypothetical protein